MTKYITNTFFPLKSIGLKLELLYLLYVQHIFMYIVSFGSLQIQKCQPKDRAEVNVVN